MKQKFSPFSLFPLIAVVLGFVWFGGIKSEFSTVNASAQKYVPDESQALVVSNFSMKVLPPPQTNV